MAGRSRSSRALRFLTLSAALTAAVACGPPPFVVHVVYPGEVEVEPGSPVLYEGVQIGDVSSVRLSQDDPARRARVVVALAIDDPGVVLRAGDAFHLSRFRGVQIVEVAPSVDESQPLVSGDRVAGVPPLVTQIEETLDAAVESIGNLAVEAIEKALAELEKEPLPADAEAPAPAPIPAPADPAP